jgi:hypothetical protein
VHDRVRRKTDWLETRARVRVLETGTGCQTREVPQVCRLNNLSSPKPPRFDRQLWATKRSEKIVDLIVARRNSGRDWFTQPCVIALHTVGLVWIADVCCSCYLRIAYGVDHPRQLKQILQAKG